MSSLEINIINGYVKLLENLSQDSKLELIEKLTDSLNLELNNKENLLKEAYGAFESDKTAEEMIDELRNSRHFNRQLESF